MSEQNDLVKLLVGGKDADSEGRRRFLGFWAEFHGHELTSHEAENGVVYTLYRCTSYRYPTFRVYVKDERSADAPVYKLFPYDYNGRGRHKIGDVLVPSYDEAYKDEEVIHAFPVFIEFLDSLEDVDIRAVRRAFIDPR